MSVAGASAVAWAMAARTPTRFPRLTSSQNGDPQDVTDDAYPVGWGTEGNEFEYNLADQVWQYNLRTKNNSAAGTYTITIVSGDESEYLIDRTCEAVFEKDE